VRALVIGVVLTSIAVSRPACADDVPDATTQPKANPDTTTLYLATAWSPGPTVPVRIGFDGALRLHRGYLAVETRLGLGGAASLTALGSQLQGHIGLGVGVVLRANDRVTFAPMVAYDIYGIWERYGASFAIHYVTLEVPASISFGRVVLEPFVQLGIARFQGATDPVVVVGPRIGFVL